MDDDLKHCLLQAAIEHDSSDVLRLLLQYGMDPNLPGSTGLTALGWAARCDAGRSLNILLTAGAFVDAEDSVGATALHWAASYERLDFVEILLRWGTDPLRRNGEGMSALDIARRRRFSIDKGSSGSVSGVYRSLFPSRSCQDSPSPRPEKRTDGLLRTRGVISNLCFVEIKKHTTPLLETSPYRPACWAPSRELAGAVSQVQGTVAQATQELRKLTGRDDNGDPTGEEAYNYMPKAFVAVGSLEQFVSEHGINEEKHRSFELFRGNTSSPEIVTFDELYERARFIVQRHDSPVGAAEVGK